MDINELEKYRLGDAVKFHQQLNPKLWGNDEHLLPEVQEKLRAIADDFREFLGIDDLRVKDITISGSNAAYTYTDTSDIDLHLVVDLPWADQSEVYRELFDAKKYQYNNQHDFVVRDFSVELYVQNANEEHVSQGIYSILNQDWVRVPSRSQPEINDISVTSKYQDLAERISQAVQSKNLEQMNQLARKIKNMRQSGLAKTGEFGPENLAFKLLKKNGDLTRLSDARTQAKDQLLSLDERSKKKSKKKTPWGRFGGMWFPGYHNIGQPPQEDHLTPADVGGESVAESQTVDIAQAVKDFVSFCRQQLNIQQVPKIQLKRDPAWSQRLGTFGRYDPDTNVIMLSVADRHPVDVMRTLAHELTHHRQNEVDPIPPGAGETGSSFEDSANATAGRIMRDFAEKYPDYFDRETIAESSGYIPVTDQEAQDPRYSMAVTQDVRPGEPKRQAAKLGFKTDPAGRPPKARTNGLIEQLSSRWQAIKESREPLEEEDLTEVAMSPGALKQWAASGAAAGMQAGFEAEVIFRGLGSDDEGDMEPDYDEDRTAGSIEDIIDFFSEGPYAGLSQRQAQNIRNELTEEYLEWADQQVVRNWSDQKVDYIDDYINNEDLFDQDTAEEEATEYLGPDADPSDIDDRVEEMRSDFLDKVLTKEFDSKIYESAYEQFRDEQMQDFDEYEWLGENERYMSDLATEFGLDWPYMTSAGGEEGFSEYNAELLADELARKLGVKTRASGGYHSARRDSETWIFEPDSSLAADDPDDMPVEIVSPPMPLAETVEILPRFFAWLGENDAYANPSTGFHMSISMPGHEGDSLDYTKLALFLGDEYVLQQFGRSANTYAASALKKIKQALSASTQNNSETLAIQALEKMRESMGQSASNLLAKPSGFGKYVSINPRDNYIEFRSAGGSDYLNDIDQIQNTLLRYARATSIAMDPEAEKQEYAKKFYKLLQPAEITQVTDPQSGRQRTQVKPQGEQDPVWLFAQYAAGALPRQALKSFVRQIQAKRPPTAKELQQRQAQASNMPAMDQNGNFEIYNTASDNTVYPFSAQSADDALNVLSLWRSSVMQPELDPTKFLVRPVIVAPADTAAQSSTSDLPFRVVYRTDNRGTSTFRVDAPDQARARAEFIRKAVEAGLYPDEFEIVSVEQMR